jgi:hypothetical protein
VICGGIGNTDAAKPLATPDAIVSDDPDSRHVPIAHLEENAATRGIALSIADMDAPERLATVARSSRPPQSHLATDLYFNGNQTVRS